MGQVLAHAPVLNVTCLRAVLQEANSLSDRGSTVTSAIVCASVASFQR